MLGARRHYRVSLEDRELERRESIVHQLALTNVLRRLIAIAVGNNHSPTADRPPVDTQRAPVNFATLAESHPAEFLGPLSLSVGRAQSPRKGRAISPRSDVRPFIFGAYAARCSRRRLKGRELRIFIPHSLRLLRPRVQCLSFASFLPGVSAVERSFPRRAFLRIAFDRHRRSEKRIADAREKALRTYELI